MFVCVLLSLFGFEGGMGDFFVLVPDHCLSVYFPIWQCWPVQSKHTRAVDELWTFIIWPLHLLGSLKDFCKGNSVVWLALFCHCIGVVVPGQFIVYAGSKVL